MHFRTHVKAEHRGISGQDEYSDGMVEHDMHVGELLKLIDDLGLANDTIVQYSTDNGLHYNTWPDAGTTQFRSEKNTNWEGAYRVSCFVRWPGHFPADKTLNGIVAHEDWLTTFAAAAGAPDIKEKLLKGVELNGRTYKNHLDSYNLLDYLSGKTKESPRKEFIYVNDIGEIVAARVGDWKVVYMENRAETVALWREPFVELRAPLLFNLRRDPLEKAQHNSNTYNDWWLDRVFVITPATDMVGEVPHDLQGLPGQPDGGLLQPDEDAEADRRDGQGRQVAQPCPLAPAVASRRAQSFWEPKLPDSTPTSSSSTRATMKTTHEVLLATAADSSETAALHSRVTRSRREFLAGAAAVGVTLLQPGFVARGTGRSEDLHHPAHQRHARELHRHGPVCGLHARSR